MFWTRHLSDDALLLAGEQAMPAWRLSRVRRHLDSCAACSRRLAHLQVRVGEMTDAWNGFVPQLPDGAAARAKLRTHMAQAANGVSGAASWSGAVSSERLWLSSCAAVGLLMAAWLAIGNESRNAASVTDASVFLRPQPDLTPGVTLPLATRDLCAADAPRIAQPIPASVHQRVFASYGADPAHADAYELDHLVTPELGGASAAGNLWPQPYGGTAWNAYVKDELEQLLHQRVCAGTMTLASAQRELSGDWIAAYQRHFASTEPLRDYARSPLTEDDADALRAELAEFGIVAPRDAGGGTMLALLHAAQREARTLRCARPRRRRY